MNKEEFPHFNFDNSTTYGFLAQDLLNIAPELVSQRSDGYLLVIYNGIIPILTEGIQELNEYVIEENIELQNTIEALQLQNKMLSDRMGKLETLLSEKE